MTARPLRAWQQEALDAFASRGRPRDFLVTATPGAGKTTFALTFAARMLQDHSVSRVIVVAPTDHLRAQWAEAASAMGIRLDGNLTNAMRRPARGFVGCVVTYAQIAAAPMLHRARVEETSTLVIMDEVHHAGDGLSWGAALEEACTPARFRLALTGTPFRTSPTETIPFVTYETESDGSQRSVADYTYSYRQGLADGVVRPVVFAAYTGTSRWRNSAGDVMSASLSEQNTRDVEAAAWKTALNPRGKWIPHVFAAADARLSEVRASTMPDAAGLILASNQDTARAYAAVLRKVTGEKPTVVLSDDPAASDKISEFSRGTGKWLVAVRMVSEGVDVPRIAVIAWCTSYRTRLFFDQAVGRAVRARRKGEVATVFLPAVRPLLALAADMESDRNHVIPPPSDQDGEDLDIIDVREDRASESLLAVEAMDADAEFAHVLYSGAAHTGSAAPANLTAEDSEFLGLPGLLDVEQMSALLRKRDAELRSKVSRVEPSEVTLDEDDPAVASALRKEINSLVTKAAARRGLTPAQVHTTLRKRVPGPATRQAPPSILRARRDYLMGAI